MWSSKNDEGDHVPLNMKIQRKRSKPTSAVAAAAAIAATAANAATDTSAVVDTGATAAAATTDTSADVDTGASAASAAVSHPPPQHSAKRRKSKKPLQPTPLVRQFQDDHTGLKLIHPSALRYCLKIVEEELQLTTKSVAQSLLEQNELVRYVLLCLYNMVLKVLWHT